MDENTGPDNTRITRAWQAHHTDSPAALQALQQTGIDVFERIGFPGRRLENWKYTDIRRLEALWPDWLQTAARSVDKDKPAFATLDVPEALTVTMVDGICHVPDEWAAQLPQGVIICSLMTAAAEHADVLQAQLGRLADPAHSGLVALNSAFSRSGLLVHIPDDIELTQPLVVHYHTSTPQITVQPRLLVSLGRNSSLTVVEHFTGTASAIVNAVAEMRCASGSRLRYNRLQTEHSDSWHTAVQYMDIAAGASLHLSDVQCGGYTARNELHVKLSGQGATANATGLFMADQQRHVESRITVEHQAPHTTSDARYRGVLAGKARGVFNGRIHVFREAQKTAAALSNRNLLLDTNAEIDTKPELEIYADDVKCAHGSTTGQLDATALFYLLSRGIDPVVARHLLIRAFVAELLSDQEIAGIREQTIQALQQLQEPETT